MNDISIRSFRQQLRKMERFLVKNLKEEGECCGVTFNECHIFMELVGCGNSCTMSDLVESLSLDKSVVSRSVEVMVKAGLIKRVEARDDRRKKLLMLTEAGKEKAQYIDLDMNRKYGKLLDQLDEDQRKRLVQSAGELIDAFELWKKSGECCV